MVTTKVDLTGSEQVQGILALVNGGTGAVSLSAAGIEQTANKNAANGYCGLNSSGYVAPGQLGSGSASYYSVLNGANIWLPLNRSNVPDVVTVSAATSLTLAVTTSCWVFSGSSAATWTLPPVSGNTGFFMLVENRGSAAITITAAGSDHIWRGSSVTTMTVAANGSLMLVNDSTYWNALSLDLINNAASLTGLPLVTPTITGYTETPYNIGTLTTSYTISLANGTVQRCTLTNADTCVFTMPSPVAGQSFVLHVFQSSTTPYSGLCTFTSVLWPATGTPAMTQASGVSDIYTFVCSDGANWYGSYAQGY